MKANEIRIGNIFKEGVITSIPMQRSEQGFDVYIGDCGRDLEELNPVPLTPEILEAAGFVTTDDITYIKGNEKFISYELHWNSRRKNVHAMGISSLDEDGNRIGVQNFAWNIEYVHQLQNLYFALTGQELTINLHATA